MGLFGFLLVGIENGLLLLQEAHLGHELLQLVLLVVLLRLQVVALFDQFTHTQVHLVRRGEAAVFAAIELVIVLRVSTMGAGSYFLRTHSGEPSIKTADTFLSMARDSLISLFWVRSWPISSLLRRIACWLVS